MRASGEYMFKVGFLVRCEYDNLTNICVSGQTCCRHGSMPGSCWWKAPDVASAGGEPLPVKIWLVIPQVLDVISLNKVVGKTTPFLSMYRCFTQIPLWMHQLSCVMSEIKVISCWRQCVKEPIRCNSDRSPFWPSAHAAILPGCKLLEDCSVGAALQCGKC